MRKLSGFVAAFLMVLGVVVLFSGRSVVADAVDITVKNVQLSNDTIKDGRSTNLSFDFSIPDTAKSGDVTTMTLPAELNFVDKRSFDVIEPETKAVVAQATIDPATKTLSMTYTDYVSTHHNVQGQLSMYLSINRELVKTEITIPVKMTFNNTTEVDFDGQTIGYQIGTGDADTTNFWKYGYMNDENRANGEITYIINVNTQAATVDKVVITDAITTEGMTYVPDSFRIREGKWTKNAANNWHQESSELVEKPITFSADNRSFSIDFGTISTGYSISYRVKADVPLNDGDLVYNTANYVVDDKVVTTSQDEIRMEGATGTAQGNRFSIAIEKQDQETGQVLAGAAFQITRKSTGEVMGTVTTDAEGKASLDRLLRDTYVIKEIKAPTGYELLTDEVEVTSDQFDVSGVATVTVQDKSLTTSIAGQKTWDDQDDKDGLRPDAITVNLLKNGTVVDSKTVTAEDDWFYRFDNLPVYDNGTEIVYSISEEEVAGYTTTVDGYNLTNTHTPTTPVTPTKPSTPKKPNTSETPKKSKSPAQASKASATGKEQRILPATGESRSVWLSLFGLIVFAGAGVVVGKRRNS